MTITDYCAASSCDKTLAAAQQDKALCPASQNTCGEFETVTKSGIDTATVYYYQGGQLIAIDKFLLPGHHACAAGPSSFVEPACGTTSQTLPACM
jgi:hypothetical protein